MTHTDIEAVRLLLAGRCPRQYGVGPTPLHRLDRFSATVGREIWIKRDDLISIGLGGNKVRKLTYLVADALAAGADHLVTVGAAQSNHARCVAAVAAMEGLGCDLVLGGASDSPIAGNLLLDRLLGAVMHFPGTDDWQLLERRSHEVADELRAAGHRPYVMPVGGSTAVGALGFVDAMFELVDQLDAVGLDPSAIVHATSSGGTQAGLTVGAAIVGRGIRVVGVGVAKTARYLEREISALATATAQLVGVGSATLPEARVLGGYLGNAYGLPTAGSNGALRTLLRTEGILVDPVYTAKALHAVIDASAAELGDGPVVFWHTGGVPSVYACHLSELESN